jgi:hypothetical protein
MSNNPDIIQKAAGEVDSGHGRQIRLWLSRIAIAVWPREKERRVSRGAWFLTLAWFVSLTYYCGIQMRDVSSFGKSDVRSALMVWMASIAIVWLLKGVVWPNEKYNRVSAMAWLGNLCTSLQPAPYLNKL